METHNQQKLESIFVGFKILVKKYPNDADLGAEVRKIIKLAMKNERTFRT